MNRMNIGMVSPYSWDFPGGVNRHVEQLADHLRGRGHRVRVIAPGGHSGEGFFSVGGSFAVSANQSKANIAFGPGVAARIRRLLRQECFDVLHLHEPLIPSASLLALFFSRCATLATFHAAREGGSTGYRLAQPILRPLAGRIDVKAVVSPAARELISRYFQGDYRVLPNGVDTALFAPGGPVLEEWTGGGFNLVFVGRDEPRKGLEVLLRALPLVRESHPEVRLLVVGVEEYASTCEGVAWLGRLADDLVPAAYRSAKIMISPALGMESFGIVLLEAMASGVPVVASDIPGYRAVLEDGVQGRLFPPGDYRALARALSGLIEDDAGREAMAESALARAAMFSWENLVEDVEAAYGDAMSIHGRDL
ncbi:MAG: glycosyltransferase family 1 protein [Actinobacteria bacterium]|jgi:phosphatidylinositol alpha-mannosyltransferase|nr:MAG: glycosyltransferase family 1 protein [Actinomycetota bacterium]